MKKLYSILFASAFSLFTISANATTIPVAISNFNFSPSSFTANIGDVIQFTLVSGTHTATSTSVPSGAATFASPTMSTVGQSFSYTVTTAGSYAFHCAIHPTTMSGTFTVAVASGIAEPNVDLSTKVYPSPFKDKVSIKSNGIELIEFFNIVGEKVKSIPVPTVESKIDVDFDDMPAGVYFFRTYKDGVVVETRKIVKAK
ncbi:MAG: copper binding protein plastocyanin [Bacteroidetes bacterium]|nr:copper binding protein plastocyanin [Bacteroidota bacterium]